MAESPTRNALFPIVQGSCFTDLRRECATALSELQADGYAIGGLSVGEPRPLSLEAVEATEDILPRAKPRYAMGVGMPLELPEYVARGVDMMDCVLPSRNARNGYLFTSEGRVIIIAEGPEFQAADRYSLPSRTASSIYDAPRRNGPKNSN
jgi:queuine tRNA-ribosyltransferase